MQLASRLFIVVAAAGTGFLLAQEPEKKPEPRPTGENSQPFQSPERRDNPEAFPPRADRPPGPGREGRPPGEPRPERPRRHEGGPREVARPYFNPNQNVPLKPQPFLGVVTRMAPAELNAQLKQPEGFGLVVEDVLDDSPAKTTGIKQNDLLRMFDDQWLVNPAQLESLVRRAGKDKEVSLTILREGAEQKLTVKIGEKSLPVRRPLPPGNLPQDFREPNQPRDGYRPPNDYRAQPGAPLDRQTRYATERARVLRRDDSGTYEVQRVDGLRVLTAKRPDGTLIWKGPVDTDEQRQAMPGDVRKKFDEIESSRPLDRLDPRPARRPQTPPAPPRPEAPEPPPANPPGSPAPSP